MSNGEVFLIGFLSTEPAERKNVYSDELLRSLEKFEGQDETDMLTYLQIGLAGHKLEQPLYVMPDRNDERIRIGKRIKALREDHDFEAKKLAQLTDIDAANLCRIEQGRYSAGLDMLCKIATALDAKVDLIPNKATGGGLPMMRQAWIIPVNRREFCLEAAIQYYNAYIYFAHFDKLKIGDIVYLYDTDSGYVGTRLIVSDTNLDNQLEPIKSIAPDFDRGPLFEMYSSYKRYDKLKDDFFAGSSYSFEDLKSKGYLKEEPTGPVRISEDLRRLLERKSGLLK